MEYRRKISMKTLVIRVLEQWRWLLLAGLILGCALGGRKASILWPKTRPVQAEPAAPVSEPEQAAAESGAEAVEGEAAAQKTASNSSTSAYEQELKLIGEQITNMQDYMLHSLFAQINFMDEDQAAADIYVDAAEARAASASSIQQTTMVILRALQRFASSGVDWTELSEELELKPAYLREAVKDITIDDDAYMFTLTVKGRSEEEAERIRDYILEQLKEVDWSDLADPELYKIRIRGLCSYKTTDPGYYSWHKNRITELNSLLSSKDSYQTALNKNRSSAAVVKATTTQSTTPKVLSKKTALKSIAKHGAAGFAAGFGGLGLLYLLFLMFCGRVLGASEFNEAYGLRSLAVLPSGTGRSVIDRLIAGLWSREYTASSREVCMRIAAEYIGSEAGEGGKVLVTGDLPEEHLKALVRELQAEDRRGLSYTAAADLGGDPEELRKLENQDAVILAAAVKKTSYGGTDKLVNAVHAFRRPIIGSIVL